MKQKLKTGTIYVLMGGLLLVVSALLLLAVSQTGRFYHPMRAPLMEGLGLPGIALTLLALAAILTPADLFSTVVVAVPLCLAFAFGVWTAPYFRQQPETAGL